MRRHGKQFAADRECAAHIREGNSVGVMGLKTEAEAVAMQKRFKDYHQTETVFEPMYRSQQPKPIFDMRDIETPIIGYEYPPKILTGYLFKPPVTLNEVESSHFLQLKGGLT